MNVGMSTNLDVLPLGRTDRRALLIDAAEELFKERAFNTVTTAEIAARAGVSYGLIAHYFTNKRGLYLACVNRVATRMRAMHDISPTGDTPAAQLREILDHKLGFVEDHPRGFITLMHDGAGPDPQVRAITEQLRWLAVVRLLNLLGVVEPLRPSLRAAIRGWVGYLDEIALDHLEHQELTREELVTLATAALAAALRAAHSLDPAIGVEPTTIDTLAAS
ncbi:hypothetical protein GCM10023321_81270 [Pseudonocardia eucalypti]|uniref:HTH tetR-type domain-containing protein n=2 Tax=Pseudonocardia eucalypti TaxID=648755 RepID=A0ABP9RCX0_9PSEU|nr:AcrR family transcriptional regulator [Pseudonocardia eucalypti]